MKLQLFHLYCFILCTHFNTYSSNQSVSTTSNSEMFLSGKISSNKIQAAKNLHATVTPYPARSVTSDGNIQQLIQNRVIKTMPAGQNSSILSKGGFSVMRPKYNDFTGYPKGASLFPGYASLSAKFDSMIEIFIQNPRFVSFFRKVHINALNELYHCLMSIYVNFNLQHTGITQTSDGSINSDIPTFLQYEQEYAANSKTLIINYLVNIIESQFNGAIRSYVPNIPQIFASSLGKTLVQNDYCVDLTFFLEKQIQPDFVKYKKEYLQGLAAYLSFFQEFTSYLHQAHQKHPDKFTAFVDIAEQINQFLYADSDPSQDQQLAAVKKMNPPLFTFNYDDIRALKMIPYLAKNMPANSKKIMWPDHIVQAANEGYVVDMPGQAPHPIAYFKTKNGTVLKNNTNDPNIPLYICMRNGANLFEEQLLSQPDWLNSWDGIALILRACFGDFSALLGLNILDPCMESLVTLATETQQGKDPNSVDTRSPECIAMLNSFKQTSTSISGTGPNLPSIPQLPSVPNIPNTPIISQPPSNTNNQLPSNLQPPPSSGGVSRALIQSRR